MYKKFRDKEDGVIKVVLRRGRYAAGRPSMFSSSRTVWVRPLAGRPQDCFSTARAVCLCGGQSVHCRGSCNGVSHGRHQHLFSIQANSGLAR
jgi:hypothetical protein